MWRDITVTHISSNQSLYGTIKRVCPPPTRKKSLLVPPHSITCEGNLKSLLEQVNNTATLLLRDRP